MVCKPSLLSCRLKSKTSVAHSSSKCVHGGHVCIDFCLFFFFLLFYVRATYFSLSDGLSNIASLASSSSSSFSRAHVGKVRTCQSSRHLSKPKTQANVVVSGLPHKRPSKVQVVVVDQCGVVVVVVVAVTIVQDGSSSPKAPLAGGYIAHFEPSAATLGIL